MSALAVSSKTATLYEMADELGMLLDSLDLTAEGSPERAECESAIGRYFGEDLPRKADAIAVRLRHFEEQNEFGKREKTRINERQKYFQRRYDRLEQYVIHAMKRLPAPATGPRKLEGRSNTLTLRPSEAVVFTDPDKTGKNVPADYRTAEIKLPLAVWRSIIEFLGDADPDLVKWIEQVGQVEESISKEDVKKALKAGVEVPGADLEDRDNLKVS